MPLPDALSILIPLLDDWSYADPSLRLEKLVSATSSDLSLLVERVLPCLPAIDEYLTTFGDQPLDETARRLLRLVESALDAKHELEARDE